MFNTKLAAITASLLFVAAAGTAQASLTVGTPVVVPGNNMQVTVTFLGSDAGYTGQLSFLGAGLSPSSLDFPAADTDAPGLGELLFNNHTSSVGSSMILPGVFDLGEILHFAYTIISPSNVAGMSFKSNLLSDASQFAYDPSSGQFGVEDLPLPGGDHDYNDAVFQVGFQQVPGPGALALMGVAGFFAPIRRRAN